MSRSEENARTREGEPWRSGATGSGAVPAGTAASAAALCENPDHRLDFRQDPTTSDFHPVPAASGTCTDKTRCLGSARLDAAVASKALSCLELDIDKRKDPVCKTSEVQNASATRTAVTTCQSNFEKKNTECERSAFDESELCTVLTDGAIADALRCLDKSCKDAVDCLQAYEPERDCIEGLFRPFR